MSGLFSYGTSTTQRTGNDAIYGQGTDGNVTVFSYQGYIVLTRDMYYNNLWVQGGTYVYTQGYKVFVKYNLLLDGVILSSTLTDGTIAAQTTSSNVSNVFVGGGG